jgi:hypothetical protein
MVPRKHYIIAIIDFYIITRDSGVRRYSGHVSLFPHFHQLFLTACISGAPAKKRLVNLIDETRVERLVGQTDLFCKPGWST